MTNIFSETEEYVANLLNSQPELSSCPFLPENLREIEFAIKSALGKQGLVGIIHTPKASFVGKYEDKSLAWEVELGCSIFENVLINRGKKDQPIVTGQDIAARVFDVLCPLSGEREGQISPIDFEQGEDSSLVVDKLRFKCVIHKTPPPPPRATTLVKYTSESGLPDQELGLSGEISYESIPEKGHAEEIDIGTDVTSIGTYGLNGCTNLTSVVIPSTVTGIGSYAFSQSNNLPAVEIPSSVSSIGEYAFEACFALKSAEIPSSVSSIGSYAFSGCTSLSSASVGNGMASIPDGMFKDCTSLSSISLGSNVRSIGNLAFMRCEVLSAIDIPSSVTNIGFEAFEECKSITSLVIPSSVESIGEYAFISMNSIQDITFMGKTLSQVQGMENYPWGVSASKIHTEL